MKNVLILTVALGLAGCASTITPLFPTSEGDITDRPYTPAADIQSQVFFGGIFDDGTPEEMCLAKMKAEVVAQGANGLIFVRYGERGYDFLLRRTMRCSGRAVRFNAK